MINEQDMPFQSEEGYTLAFSKMLGMILKFKLFNLFVFCLFTLNKFYTSWDSASVAFDIFQNEWEMNKM
jgi:hypothetical protein